MSLECVRPVRAVSELCHIGDRPARHPEHSHTITNTPLLTKNIFLVRYFLGGNSLKGKEKIIFDHRDLGIVLMQWYQECSMAAPTLVLRNANMHLLGFASKVDPSPRLIFG